MRATIIDNLVFVGIATLGVAITVAVLYGPSSMSTDDKAFMALCALSLPSVGAFISYVMGVETR